jgi:hypothetical protein
MNATILGLTPDVDRGAVRLDRRVLGDRGIPRPADQDVLVGDINAAAFSVSVNVDADILGYDEALSVGRRALPAEVREGHDSLRESGKTLLFVSHDPNAVNRLCSTAILLERGRLLVHASPRDTMNIYSKLLADDAGGGGRGGHPAARGGKAADRRRSRRVRGELGDRRTRRAPHRR